MGDVKGFLEVKRKVFGYRPIAERVKDYREVGVLPKEKYSQEQASRCMDCGVPFCHWGCPLGNSIPEWNDLVFDGHWQRALQLLMATNNFPEITARICPALCEYSCVLGINDDPVTIRENELAIIEYGFKMGFIKPHPPKKRSGKEAAVIGSGPAGLACADELNKLGHKVTVFERDASCGGILRYGIPDFKLEKRFLDRRLKLLEREGIEFITGVDIGRDVEIQDLRKKFDALCLAIGSRIPRDLGRPTDRKMEGRDLGNIYFAMDYLVQSNKKVSRERVSCEKIIDAKNKRVVLIGGGDTGADCVGVAHRQGAKFVAQIELFPKPPECRGESCPWPKYPLLLKNSTSHEEGGERFWAVLTKKFSGENGLVKKLHCARVDFSQKDAQGCSQMEEIAGSEFEIEADLVILAMGFVGPQREGLIDKLGLELDARGCIKTDAQFMTSAKGVFSAGDARRGQSLVVWAISEGRKAAYGIDRYLKH